eukprot:g30712.t1
MFQVAGTDKGDHPPITPIKAAPKDEFSKGKEWRLYEYVTRHFIASLMDDASYDEIRYVFDVAGEHFTFTYHEEIRACRYEKNWPQALFLLGHVQTRGLQRDVISYNSVLSISGTAGRWRLSLKLLKVALDEQQQLDQISFTSAITASSTSLRWSSSLALCSAFRFATASVTDAKLLGAVAAGNEWRWAVKLLEMEVDLIICNSTVTACARASLWLQALVVLCADRRLQPDVITQNAALSALEKVISASVKGLAWAESLRSFLQLALLNFHATSMDHWLIEKDAITWNTSIRSPTWEWAWDLLAQTPNPDMNTYNTSISQSPWPEALALLEFLGDPRLLGAMLDLISSALTRGDLGAWARTWQLLEQLEVKRLQLTLVTCHSILSYAEWSLALWLLQEAFRLDLEVSILTFGLAMSAIERAAKWPSAVQLLDFMQTSRLGPSTVAYNGAIGATSRGAWHRALALFQNMERRLRRDVVGYGAAMSALAGGGADWPSALLLLQEQSRTDTLMLRLAVKRNRAAPHVRSKSIASVSLSDHDVGTNNLPSYVICDPKKKGHPIRHASQGFQELFGYSASECIGLQVPSCLGAPMAELTKSPGLMDEL